MADYYYEQPYEEVAPQSSLADPEQPTPENNRRRMIIIGLIVFGVILLILLLVLITSRQRPTTVANNTTGPDTSRNVILQFRGAFLSSTVMQPLIDEYQAANPNVKIEYADRWPSGSYQDASEIYRSEINRVLKDGDSVNIPDIFMVNNRWTGDYDSATYTYPSPNAYYTLDTFSSIFHPAVVTDFANDGKVHGVPMWMDTLAVLYNKDLLSAGAISEPAKTWNEFKSQAQSLTKRENNQIKVGGFAGGTTNNTTYAFDIVNTLMYQNGVEILDSTGLPSFSSFPETITALNFYKSFASGSAATWNTSMKNDAAAFLEGKAAMIVSTSYRYRDILKYNKAYDIGLNIGVSRLPQLSSGQSQEIFNFADYWGAMVSNARGNGDYAWAFLKWLSEPDQYKKISENIKNETSLFGILYPRKDMSTELVNDPDLAVFNESLPFAQSWYMGKGYQVQEEFLKLVSGSVNQSNVTSTERNIQTIQDSAGQL